MLSIEKSIDHLITCARRREFSTYLEIAKANGHTWEEVWLQMRGPKNHLDDILKFCHENNFPLLTAIVVQQENKKDGKLKPFALKGFVEGVGKLGIEVKNRSEFLKKCQKECFEFYQVLPLILTNNEVIQSGHDWKDILGEQFHFPNGYLNKIRANEGKQFIYYRGGQRADNSRGEPAYIGTGIIGYIFEDPDTLDLRPRNKNWFCKIIDYAEFPTAVPFKNPLGEYLEEVTRRNHFRDGTREISFERFKQILGIAGFSEMEATNTGEGQGEEIVFGNKGFSLPQIEDVVIPNGESEDEIYKFSGKKKNPKKGDKKSPTGKNSTTRRSKNSTAIGKRGEKIAYEFFKKTLDLKSPETLKDVAKENKGWDIEFENDENVLQKIEVKSTSGAGMNNFEITKNELDSLFEDPENYRVFVVTNVTGKSPQIREIKDIFSKLENGEISKEPIRWKIY